MRLEYQIGAVSSRLFVGPFLTPARAAYLQSLQVTDVLNVGEAPSIITAEEYGFRSIHDRPIADLALIPDVSAIEYLRLIHGVMQAKDARVYVHCIAGQNRSPTVAWLYLVACGVRPADAKTIIEASAPDAVPGHGRLVDARLIELVCSPGAERLGPIPEDAVTPFRAT